MIKIVITQIDVVNYTEKRQICIKETPTDKVKEYGIGGQSAPVMAREYQIVDTPLTRQVSTDIYIQNIDESEFDLPSVIKAINNL